MIKKERTQKTDLRRKWKVTGVVYKKGGLTENRKTERVQIRLKGSIEKNRKKEKRRNNKREGKKDIAEIFMGSLPKECVCLKKAEARARDK